MKTYNLIFTALVSLTLAACGNNPNNGLNSAYTGGGYNNYGNNLASGQVMFTAQNAMMNDCVIKAGPQFGGGQVMMGTGGAYNGYGTMTKSQPGINGNVTLSVSSQYFRYGMGCDNYVPATVTGVVQLAPTVLAALQAQSGYLSMPYGGYPYGQISPYNGYNNYGYQMYGAASTVNSLSFDAVITPSGNGGYNMPIPGIINQVLMYLNMNNGSAATPIIF